MTLNPKLESLNKYLADFATYFPEIKNPDEFVNFLIKPHLTNFEPTENEIMSINPFRSIYWRVYLGCFSNKRENWMNEALIYRQIYRDLKAKHLPVTDEQLLVNVKQDVRRTMPDKKIFRQKNIQNMMTNILLIWSIASPCGKRLSYRQGVHELLAPMIFVLMADHANFSCMKEIENELEGELPINCSPSKDYKGAGDPDPTPTPTPQNKMFPKDLEVILGFRVVTKIFKDKGVILNFRLILIFAKLSKINQSITFRKKFM